MITKKEFPKGTVILFVSLIVLLILIYVSKSVTQKSIPRDLIAVLRPQAIPLQPFILTGPNEQPFTEKNLKGKWSFIFFGYTYCPDVCPTTLSTLKLVNKVLKEKHQVASDMQVIFVSIDPERDTPKTLEKYTSFFNKDFIGVTGHPDNLLGFSRQFGAAYIKEPQNAPNDYLIGHTSSVFLVDPRMQIIASFSPPHYAETIVSQYLQIHDLFK